jgi:phage shock protein PspC (stress-responsive transcriptional regulator)
MNGSNRLYRGTSEAMLGGVAAGLGNYFKVDPTLIRLGFAAATFFTGGAFLLVYGAMWLLIPTVGSSASDPGAVVNENLNEIGSKIRGFVGSSGGNGSPNGSGNGNGSASQAAGSEAQYNQAQLAQGSTTTAQHRHGFNPKVLILVGGFFLLMNMGLFRGFHMGFWWPVLLIGLGVIMLSRRRP